MERDRGREGERERGKGARGREREYLKVNIVIRLIKKNNKKNGDCKRGPGHEISLMVVSILSFQYIC